MASETKTNLPGDTQAPVKIIFNLIVRNESKIICRCLDSCKPIADAFSICDTGSDDNTVEIIENWFKENNVTGKVFFEPWDSFSHNRTKSMQLAQAYAAELGWDLERSYAFQNDADMSLVVTPQFKKQELTGIGYYLTQRNNYSYVNTRLTQMSLPWVSRTFTHEFWGFLKGTGPANTHLPLLKTLWLDDKSDGGYKANKFKRDVKLCKRGLIEDPELRDRYLFYLAQSYMCLNKNEKAIKYYKMRTEAGGFYGEIWFAMYTIGDCYSKLGDWPQAMEWYLNAYQYDSHRAEPLFKIARHYREKPDKQELGFMYAEWASRIPKPPPTELFVDNNIYDFDIDYERALCGFYTKDSKEIGYQVAEKVTLQDDIPEFARARCHGLLLHYAKKLNWSYNKEIPFTPKPIEDPAEDCPGSFWNSLNPSIVKDDEGYSMILRTVNYYIDSNGHYQYKTKERNILTRNYFLKLDGMYNLVSADEIMEPSGKKFAYHIKGMEDCRLFKHDGRYYFTCTSLEHHSSHAPQICLALLAPKARGGKIQVESFTLLKGHQEEGKCEKNWLPFSHKNEIRVIYNYDPLTVSRVSQTINQDEVEKGGLRRRCLEALDVPELEVNISDYRGSSSPLPYKGGWLFVIHEVHMAGKRNYLHRFVHLGEDFSLKRISRSFYFHSKGIEYCSGLCFAHDKKCVILTAGINDSRAEMFAYPLDRLEDSLYVINVNHVSE